MTFLLLVACGAEPGAPADDPRRTEPTDPCPSGQVLDGEACVPEACGAGPWGNLPVDGDPVYVAAGGAGDGSADAPLGSLQAAVDLAGDRGAGAVLVGAGIWQETLLLERRHDGVGLLGRCPELVTLDGSAGEEVPAIEIVGARGAHPEVTLGGLTVTGGRYGGLWVDTATLVAESLDVVGNTGVGLFAVDAEVTLDAVSIRDTVSFRQGDFGRGVGVEGDATLTASGCRIVGNQEHGVHALGEGARVVLVDSLIADTVPRPDGAYGRGIGAEDGGDVEATGCRVAGNTEIGVFVAGPGSSATLASTVVEDTVSTPDGSPGRGLGVQDGGALMATGCTIARNAHAAIFVDGERSTADLVDTVLGEGAYGVFAQGGARVDVRGGTVSENDEVGVVAFDPGTRVDLEDTLVEGTGPDASASFSPGLGVQDGARLTATGCTVSTSTGIGAFAARPEAVLSLVDTTVSDTRPNADGTGGAGVWAQLGATLDLAGGTVSGNTSVALFVGGAGTVAQASELTVQDTRRGAATGMAAGVLSEELAVVSLAGGRIEGTQGPALYVVDRASLTATDTAVDGSGFAGAVVLGATMDLTRVSILGTTPDAQWAGGFGVYVLADAGPGTLGLHGSTIGPHPYAAVWLDGDGTYVLDGNDLAGSVPYDLYDRPVHGNAVFAERGVRAWDGTTGLSLVDNHFQGAQDVAVLLDESTAWLAGNTFEDNGTDVWQQRCDEVDPVASADPDWVVCDGATLLTDWVTRFSTLYLPETEPL